MKRSTPGPCRGSVHHAKIGRQVPCTGRVVLRKVSRSTDVLRPLQQEASLSACEGSAETSGRHNAQHAHTSQELISSVYDDCFFLPQDDLASPHQPMARPVRFRSPLVSVVASATISPAIPVSRTMDVANLASKVIPTRPPTDVPGAALVHTMRQVAKHQQNLWDHASRAGAGAAQLAQAIPAASAALASLANDVATVALSNSGRAARSVSDQLQEDMARLQQAWVALQLRGDTLQKLQAKVETLAAERDSLASHLEEANRRAQFAESQAAAQSTQLDAKRALRSLDDAMQVFRRHVSSVPLDLAPSMFQEQPANIIGKGGCATVYKWQVGSMDWAVKSDPISYRHAYQHEFDPQRCGDLLPAFLPPHVNIMAPRAWWVDALPQATAQQATTRQAPTAASGFKLYTLYEKYSCSLWDHMQLLHTSKQQAQAPAVQLPAATAQAQAAVAPLPRCSANALPPVVAANNGGASLAAAGRAAGEPLLLDLRSLLTVVRDVAAALEHLAAHRVVHGDVKAENVLLVLHPESAAGQAPRVARAVLIDFGLAALLPLGKEKSPARGGTWLFKAPEQMSGPPGICLGGQELSPTPHVELQTDVWSLGALIALLCNNGVLPSKSGLPFGVPEDQLLKWGDRPKNGSQEPFFMTWDDVLPKLSGSSSPIRPDDLAWGACAATEEQAELQSAHVMALLRRLAWGCLQVKPSQRLTAAQVRVAAAEALSQLSSC